MAGFLVAFVTFIYSTGGPGCSMGCLTLFELWKGFEISLTERILLMSYSGSLLVFRGEVDIFTNGNPALKSLGFHRIHNKTSSHTMILTGYHCFPFRDFYGL